MKRTTVLIPVWRQEPPCLVEFMEILAEPHPTSQRIPTFSYLDGLGLERAIGLAETVLTHLGKQKVPTAIYWSNPLLEIYQQEAAALGLTLGSLATLAHPTYTVVIVFGRLLETEIQDGKSDLHIAECGFLRETFAAIYALGRPPQPTCLLLPDTVATSAEWRWWIDRIERLGVVVHLASTLPQALSNCYALAPKISGDLCQNTM